MISTPHELASRAGLSILREGGNAIEAMVAAAATIAVVAPHMNSLGGDGFWLILKPDHPPFALRACGPAALRADIPFYERKGYAHIPTLGPLAANTVAGAVSGWQQALGLSQQWGGQQSLARLLSDAIHHAEHGVKINGSLQRSWQLKFNDLRKQPHWFDTFGRQSLQLKQPALAHTLRMLAQNGLDDFYRGSVAKQIAQDLEAMGSPLGIDDLSSFKAQQVEAISLTHSRGTFFNLPPPTQGLVSLLILGILDKLDSERWQKEVDFAHAIIECTKLAFTIRDQCISDPNDNPVNAEALLSSASLHALAKQVNYATAAPWPTPLRPGDTVWMGACDQQGIQVSYIQSIYHEFGSGCVLPNTGIHWQNRGSAFSLDPTSIRALKPKKLPFHTLNPAAARLSDGQTVVFGTMGGDGQPQTQAQIILRLLRGQSPPEAVNAPRWVLGRTWGAHSDTLKCERRFSEAFVHGLQRRGHLVEWLTEYDDAVGHAGLIVRDANGLIRGAADPRANGVAYGL